MLAALFYLGGIAWAGVASLKSVAAPDIPQPVTQFMTGIASILTTYFGAIFGISQFIGPITKPKPNPIQVSEWMGVVNGDPQSQPTLNILQVIAVYLHVFGLLGAAIFWFLDGFSPESADIIKNMSATLSGIILGIVTIMLNLKNQP